MGRRLPGVTMYAGLNDQSKPGENSFDMNRPYRGSYYNTFLVLLRYEICDVGCSDQLAQGTLVDFFNKKS